MSHVRPLRINYLLRKCDDKRDLVVTSKISSTYLPNPHSPSGWSSAFHLSFSSPASLKVALDLLIRNVMTRSI
jgi:hypothetical protein